MNPSRLVVTILITYYLAQVCVAKAAHGPAGKAHQKVSSKANVFSVMNNLMDDILQPTTKSPNGAVKTITKTAKSTKSSIDAVAETITGLIDRVKRTQSKTESAAQKKIDNIVSRSEAISLKLGGEPGCVAENMGKAGALIMQTGLDEVNCPGNKIVKLEDMLETVVQSGQTALTMVPQAAIDLDKCIRRGGVFVSLCEAKIPIDLGKRALSVGVRVSGVAAQAATLATTIEASLPTCAALKVAEASAKAAQLVGKFGICSGKAAIAVVT